MARASVAVAKQKARKLNPNSFIDCGRYHVTHGCGHTWGFGEEKVALRGDCQDCALGSYLEMMSDMDDEAEDPVERTPTTTDDTGVSLDAAMSPPQSPFFIPQSPDKTTKSEEGSSRAPTEMPSAAEVYGDARPKEGNTDFTRPRGDRMMTDADYLGFMEQHNLADVAVKLNMTTNMVRNNQNQALQRTADRQGKSVQEVRGTFYDRCAKLASVASKNASELRRQHKGTPATRTPKQYRPREQKKPATRREDEEPARRYAPYPQRPPMPRATVPVQFAPLMQAPQFQYGYPAIVPVPVMYGPPVLCAPPPPMLVPYQVSHVPVQMVASGIPPPYAAAGSHVIGPVPPHQPVATQPAMSLPYRPANRPIAAPLRVNPNAQQEPRPSWAGHA